MDPLSKLSIIFAYISKMKLSQLLVDLWITWKEDTMVSKVCVCALVCVGLSVVMHTLVPKASALKRASNVDEYTVEDRRTDLRRNYVLQGFGDRLADYGPKYEDSAPAGTGTLPGLIVDYANMIRNDIILLDNSVETRTRKRGNIKVKKHTNQAVSNVPCNCERSVTNARDEALNYVNLTDAWGTRLVYPERIRNVTCDDNKCASPYHCHRIIYNLTVLKGTHNHSEMKSAGQLYDEMPNELHRRWVPKVVPVVAGCLCARRYVSNDLSSTYLN